MGQTSYRPDQIEHQYAPVLPSHCKKASHSLVVGLVGALMCQVLSPYAVWLAIEAEKEIAARPAAYANDWEAKAGKWLGITGSLFFLAMGFTATYDLAKHSRGSTPTGSPIGTPLRPTPHAATPKPAPTKLSVERAKRILDDTFRPLSTAQKVQQLQICYMSLGLPVCKAYLESMKRVSKSNEEFVALEKANALLLAARRKKDRQK